MRNGKWKVFSIEYLPIGILLLKTSRKV